MTTLLLAVAVLQVFAAAKAATCIGCDADDDSSILLQAMTETNINTNTDDATDGFKHVNKLFEDLVGDPSSRTNSQLMQTVNKLFDGLIADPNARDKSKVVTIKEILRDILMPGLISQHNASQRELEDHAQAIHNCTVAAEENNNTLAKTREDTVKAADAHETCQEEQNTTAQVSKSYCEQAQAKSDEIHNKDYKGDFLSTSDPTDHEAIYKYLTDTMAYLNEALAKLKELDASCASSTATHDQQKLWCADNKTASENLCVKYRETSKTYANSSDVCYDVTNSTYHGLKVQVENLVLEWKQEYTSIKKIECYLDVWLEDGNISTVSMNKASTCEDMKLEQIDTSALDINYPTISEKKEVGHPEVAECGVTSTTATSTAA